MYIVAKILLAVSAIISTILVIGGIGEFITSSSHTGDGLTILVTIVAGVFNGLFTSLATIFVYVAQKHEQWLEDSYDDED